MAREWQDRRRFDYGGREIEGWDRSRRPDRLRGNEGAGPVSSDNLAGTTEGDFHNDYGTGIGDRYDREDEPRYGDRRNRPGFPHYGREVGYLDRGWSGEPGYGGRGAEDERGMGSGFGAAGGGGYANRRTGDYRGYQGAFSERGAGRSYDHGSPDWADVDREGGQYAEPRENRGHGPHRGRGPKNWVRPDERILDDVHHRLTDDPHLDATDISVRVENGEVTLDGHVDSRSAKRPAEDCADSVSGVRHCQNNLRVRDGATADAGAVAEATGRQMGSSPGAMSGGRSGSDAVAGRTENGGRLHN